MFHSMTAYGRHRETVGGDKGDITVELRSVNSRYFDCSVRLPRALSYLEERVKPYLQSKNISRGKVEVNISLDQIPPEGASVSLDSVYAAGYIKALRRLRDEFSLDDDISVMTVAQNRELFIFTKPPEDAEGDWQIILRVLEVAVEHFLTARRTEGANLETDVMARLRTIRKYTAEIAQQSAAVIHDYQEKLQERLRALIDDHKIATDENRLLTECAIFADRTAIDEELVRLDSHIETFAKICASNSPVGRKLDFLIQEMNREINTIGSKCSSTYITGLVVDCKCELEKIREQIQNVE